MIYGLELYRDDTLILYREFDKNSFSIGSTDTNDLCIPDKNLSNILCRITFCERKCILENHSEVGTRLNGEMIFEKVQLAKNDMIDLGLLQGKIVVRSLGETKIATNTKSLVDCEKQQKGPFFVVVKNSHSQDKWLISQNGITIGTNENSDIVLKDDFVSGLHARVYMQTGRVFVEDLRSRNGIFLNGVKVVQGEFQSGMLLRLGNTQLHLFSKERMAKPNKNSNNVVPLIGSSKIMRNLRHFVGKIAGLNIPVLIYGETGTGKEVVAQQIYAQSKRYNKPFITLNCSTLNPNLIASELFGHCKGAFTGAVENKKGAFEAANGGTLFLDEVGELPIELQAQLLRVLEYGEIRKVGTTQTAYVDVKLIAATNRDLRKEVAKGQFREDLYHRLNMVELTCPALRERMSDLPELVDFFLEKISPYENKYKISDEFLRKLAQHRWPGNVRELRNILQQAVIFSEGQKLGESDVRIAEYPRHNVGDVSFPEEGTYTLAALERKAIVAELVARSGNKKESAAALGISRSTIHRKIDEYNINVDLCLG